jgi:hypothetical protein
LEHSGEYARLDAAVSTVSKEEFRAVKPVLGFTAHKVEIAIAFHKERFGAALGEFRVDRFEREAHG